MQVGLAEFILLFIALLVIYGMYKVVKNSLNGLADSEYEERPESSSTSSNPSGYQNREQTRNEQPESDKLMASVLLGRAVDAATISRNYAYAIRLFTEALQYDPNNGEIHHNRGMAYSSLENWREAISDFSRAIILSPSPLSYEQRGLVYYKIGDRGSAFSDWQSALKMDPRRTFAMVNLAWLAIEEGQFQQAIELCSRAILIEPTRAKAYENRARAYFEMGYQKQGLADIQTARELVATGRNTSNIDRFE